MDILIEIIFRGLIVHVLGLNSRYYFFKIIGKQKSKKYLSGDIIKKDSTDIILQHIFNVVIGLIVFAILSFTIAYLVFS